MFASRKPNPNFPEILDVTADEVWARREELSIIDVRRPDEFAGELGHIAGARLLTLDLLPGRIDELPKNQTIVFVCRSGQRSARAAQFARQHGFENCYNLDGGMLRWNELGLHTERESSGN